MNTDYHITAESFGDEIPQNWQEITAYLNARIDEMDLDSLPENERRVPVDELWESFWRGDVHDVDGLAAYLNSFNDWDESQDAALDELAEIACIGRESFRDEDGDPHFDDFVRAIEDALHIDIGGR